MKDKETGNLSLDALKALESIVQHADSILDDYEEYFNVLGSKMSQVLRRIGELVETMPELSREEICMECYSCFTQLTRLHVILDLIDERNALLLVTGNESKEEDWYNTISDLLHKFIRVLRPFVLSIR